MEKLANMKGGSGLSSQPFTKTIFTRGSAMRRYQHVEAGRKNEEETDSEIERRDVRGQISIDDRDPANMTTLCICT